MKEQKKKRHIEGMDGILYLEEDLWEKWTRRLPIFQNAFN